VFDTSMMGISESDFAPANPFKLASPKALKKSMESLRAYCVVARPMAVKLQGGETDERNPITTLIVSFGTIRKQALKRVPVVSTGDRRMDEAAKQVAEDKQKKLDKEHKYRHLVEDFRDSIAEMRTEFAEGPAALVLTINSHLHPCLNTFTLDLSLTLTIVIKNPHQPAPSSPHPHLPSSPPATLPWPSSMPPTPGLGKFIVDRIDSAMMSGKDLVTTFEDDVGKDKMMLSASAIGLTYLTSLLSRPLLSPSWLWQVLSCLP
jgi:hypothetical protein